MKQVYDFPAAWESRRNFPTTLQAHDAMDGRHAGGKSLRATNDSGTFLVLDWPCRNGKPQNRV